MPIKERSTGMLGKREFKSAIPRKFGESSFPMPRKTTPVKRLRLAPKNNS